MPRAKEPPFYDQPAGTDGKQFWTQSWFEWLRDLYTRINERLSASGTFTPGNYLTTNSAGDVIDSGETAPDLSGYLRSADYITQEEASNSFITENLLPEAGTEHGARFGSYRIGLLSDDDYAYFDENGKLLFYGTSGVRIITPVAASSSSKYAVFDSDGNIKYYTAEQLAADLDHILATRTYVSETFITESTLPEAGTGITGDAVADATGAGDVVAQLNALLSELRSIGIISE